MIDLAAVLRKYGIAVKMHSVPGRTNSVDWCGLMFHHTASNPPKELPSLGIVQEGRPDVTGPLANFMGPRGGGYAVHVTDGGANHPGAGDLSVLTRLMAGQQPTGSPGRDTPGASTHARRRLIGWEVENSGVGEPWAEGTLSLVSHSFAAFCMEFRWNPLVVIIGHKEWTRRKIDPFPIDMTAFRYQVVLLTRTDAPITPPKPTPSEEDQLMSAANDIIAAVNAHTDQKIAEAFAAKQATDSVNEWDTRKLTVPRAARVDGTSAQFYVVGTEAGPRRIWIKSQAQLDLLRTMHIVSYREEAVLPKGSREAAEFIAIPIAGDIPGQ